MNMTDYPTLHLDTN